MFHFHKYAPWSELIPTYHHVMQYRYCTICNKIQSRETEYNSKCKVSLWNHKHEKVKNDTTRN